MAGSLQIIYYLRFFSAAGSRKGFQLNHYRIKTDEVRTIPGMKYLAFVRRECLDWKTRWPELPGTQAPESHIPIADVNPLPHR